jgi:hypothetical protein
MKKNIREPRTDKEYDALGTVVRNRMHKNYVKVEKDSAGRKVNAFYFDNKDSAKLNEWLAYEYDDADHIVKKAHYGSGSYNKNDSANLQYWHTYEYDSAGRILKDTYHSKHGSSLQKSYAYVFSADDRWTYTYSYASDPAKGKSASRMHREEQNLWTHDLIWYDKDDSIFNIKTDYYQYNAQGQLIESGKMNYGSGNSYAANQMILDRKLKGVREVAYRYEYDTLGKVHRILNDGNVLVYIYNSKNQVHQAIYHFDKPYPGDSKMSLYVKYEYDANGLLIREIYERPSYEPPEVINYEYWPCIK